jgi:hypothetical protein
MNNWLAILDKVSKLKKNVLQSYRIFFEDLKGRMKSLNILDPDPFTISVLNKATGLKKLITIPQYTSIWRLREVIGTEFNL